ncbi:unannotated protein [freshwater metagenome]|uniref:Unannotated protein n=1 Tax=freshwater metagenome TaxID=449393 RepID=A0A6J6QAQ1_9ZZZZ
MPIATISWRPLNDSIPTTAMTPMKPTINPNNLPACQTVLSPKNEAKMAAQIGTVATNNPANPEVIFCSATVMKYQGPTNSVTV